MSSSVISSIMASTTAATSMVESDNSLSTNDEDFMTLLLAQLQYQDPLNPMDSTAMMGQLAQLNSLNALNAIKENMAQLNKSQSMSYAASLIGKTIAYPDPDDQTQYCTGVVESTTTQDTGVYVQVDGLDVDVKTIAGVTEE